MVLNIDNQAFWYTNSFFSTLKNIFLYDQLAPKVVAHTYMHLRERYNHRELDTGRESDKRKRKRERVYYSFDLIAAAVFFYSLSNLKISILIFLRRIKHLFKI
jgi:hypothetical protein